MTFEELQEFSHKSRTDGRDYSPYKSRQIILEMCTIASPRSIVEVGFYCGHTTLELLKAGYSVTSIDYYCDANTESIVKYLSKEYPNFTFIHGEYSNLSLSGDLLFWDGDAVDVDSIAAQNYLWTICDFSPSNIDYMRKGWKQVLYDPTRSGLRLFLNTEGKR